MSLAAFAVIAGAVATFGRRPPRAIVRQPGDYVTAISAEFRHANTIGEGFRMAKQVTGMFWNCFEIRMLERRVWSGLAPYQALKEVVQTNAPDIDCTVGDEDRVVQQGGGPNSRPAGARGSP